MLITKIKALCARIGREIRYTLYKGAPFPDMETSFLEIYGKCKPFTITSVERMYSLYKAVEYIAAHKIPGDVVECGVYKGGSSMLCAYTLSALHITDKNIYLYDTFEGMSKPTERDKTHFNASAMGHWEDHQKGEINKWCYAPLEAVKKNMVATGYPLDKMKFIKGKVEETIPQTIPDQISLLRLDTDWYESTYHELQHLFRRLSSQGVIIIDDYGHWKGAREAADKFFKENNVKILLNRIDYTGRIGIKV